MHVLVVEHDDALREALCGFLADEGFEACGARNGFEALDLLRHFRPRAIIVDLDMPLLDGWTFMDELDTNDELARIPRFVLSGSVDVDVRSSVGHQVFPKPLDREELVFAVRAGSVAGRLLS
jgi:DNA-binding response OmpR family regulator